MVRMITIYAKVLHTELISLCVSSTPTSLTWCKTKLAINIQSFLSLHNKYTVKIVTNRKIIAEMNMKMSMM